MSLLKNFNKICGLSDRSVLINLLIITVILIIALAWQKYNSYKEQDKLNYKIATILANDMANNMQLNYQELTNQHLIAANDLNFINQIYWQRAIKENLNHGTYKINIVNNNANTSLTSYSININWKNPYNNKNKIFTTTLILPHKPQQNISELTKNEKF